MSKTFLTRKDVKEALLKSQVMSSYEQMVSVLYTEIEKAILTNMGIEKETDVKRWIAQEKKDRATERKNADRHNAKIKAKRDAGEYVDPNDEWWLTPPPNSMTYRGVTVCGWCLARKGEKIEEGSCHRTEFHKNVV